MFPPVTAETRLPPLLEIQIRIRDTKKRQNAEKAGAEPPPGEYVLRFVASLKTPAEETLHDIFNMTELQFNNQDNIVIRPVKLLE